MNLNEALTKLKEAGYIRINEDAKLDDVNKTINSIFKDDISANLLYYILRLEINKGPQTINKYEEYLTSKNLDPTVRLQLKNDSSIRIQDLIRNYGVNDGKKWMLRNSTRALSRITTSDTLKMISGDNLGKYTMGDFFDNWLRQWHENSKTEDKVNPIVQMFWNWYKEKKAGNETKPPVEIIKYFNNTDADTIQNDFGKYYKFALGQLQAYLSDTGDLSEEDKLITAFWDWHRAKKSGKPYPMPEDVITGMLKFLKTSKALEVMQQYYYYAVRVIEKLADTIIKTPVNLTGLQKELKRIMDNLDNEDFVDELEKIELNRLHGGDMTAGPVFVLPREVITTIRDLARDTSNVDKSKVGKIDKQQVKECYVYCTNELNRKFHIGRTGIFDLNIQDFYDTYKIVFQRGFNTKTLHKIFDEVCQYLLDQLDKGTAEYWKNRGKIELSDVEDFNEAKRFLNKHGYILIRE